MIATPVVTGRFLGQTITVRGWDDAAKTARALLERAREGKRIAVERRVQLGSFLLVLIRSGAWGPSDRAIFRRMGLAQATGRNAVVLARELADDEGEMDPAKYAELAGRISIGLTKHHVDKLNTTVSTENPNIDGCNGPDGEPEGFEPSLRQVETALGLRGRAGKWGGVITGRLPDMIDPTEPGYVDPAFKEPEPIPETTHVGGHGGPSPFIEPSGHTGPAAVSLRGPGPDAHRHVRADGPHTKGVDGVGGPAGRARRRDVPGQLGLAFEDLNTLVRDIPELLERVGDDRREAMADETRRYVAAMREIAA